MQPVRWRCVVLLVAFLAAACGDESSGPSEGDDHLSTSSTTTTLAGDSAVLAARAEAAPDEYDPPSVPTLSVTPSTGLVDGQVIAVLAEGLPPGEETAIPACNPWESAPATGPQCVFTSSGTGTVDAQGRLWFPNYKLAAKEAAIGFNCAEPPGCELAWYTGQVGEAPLVTMPIEVTG